MDAFVDAIVWHYSAFLRTDRGDTWRISFDDRMPLIQRLMGDETEYYEPLTELRSRAWLQQQQ